MGRSTQIRLLRPWLEQQGRAVLDTAIKRSELAGKGIQQAKEGHTLGRITLSLFYATDFADRLEHEIVPALRAGFVVLTDRYIYSLMARAIVRGADPRWIRNVVWLRLKTRCHVLSAHRHGRSHSARGLLPGLRLLGVGNGYSSQRGHVR